MRRKLDGGLYEQVKALSTESFNNQSDIKIKKALHASRGHMVDIARQMTDEKSSNSEQFRESSNLLWDSAKTLGATRSLMKSMVRGVDLKKTAIQARVNEVARSVSQKLVMKWRNRPTTTTKPTTTDT